MNKDFIFGQIFGFILFVIACLIALFLMRFIVDINKEYINNLQYELQKTKEVEF